MALAKLIEEHADEYAPFLCGLWKEMDEWVLRRVVCAAISDEDTVQVKESIDFNLRLFSAFKRYVCHVRRKCLPLVVPVGSYPNPFVSFDLRDRDENRLSLVTAPTRDVLKREMEKYAGKKGYLMKCPGELALVQLPLEQAKERCIIHYSYVTSLRIVPPYQVDPTKNRPELPYTLSTWRRFWAHVGLAINPAKLTVDLTHPTMCRVYHVEIQAPEGINVYHAYLSDDAGNRVPQTPTCGLPPTSKNVRYRHAEDDHYRGIGERLHLVAWLGLDRRGFPSAAVFLGVLNFVAPAILFALGFCNPPRFGEGFKEVLATVGLITVVISLGYLQFPAEHPLVRGLYRPVRWLLAYDVGSIFVIFLLGILGAIRFDFMSYLAFSVALILLLAIFATWWRSDGSWIENWIENKGTTKNRYGRYVS